MSFYFTDTIELSHITRDPVYGTETAETKVVKCRHEAKNKLITNQQGQDIRTHTQIFMSPDEEVLVGDSFKILTKNGRPYRNPTKEYQVKTIFDNACFGTGVLEVDA